MQRAAYLLATVKKEEWDSRTPHGTHDVSTLAKAQVMLALASPQSFGKYSPDQPRVPAGNGRQSGEWTTAGSGTSTDSGSISTDDIRNHPSHDRIGLAAPFLYRTERLMRVQAAAQQLMQTM